MKKLSIAYFGTPDFSARFLEKLLNDKEMPVEVKLVITQPDQPVGRKQIITPSPVKQIAQKHQVKVANNFKSYDDLKPLMENIDMAFLFAYGITLGIIPKQILTLPKYGFLNTHPSLLPKYRGASPMVYPLILGDKKTGVTLIRLDEEVDHGPIIAQEEIEINLNDRRPDLEMRLTDLAFEMFKRVILMSFQGFSRHSGEQSQVPDGTWQSDSRIVLNNDSGHAGMTLKPQDHLKATFTRQMTKDDGFIPFSILKKAINNEPFTFQELPKIILEYINEYNLVENWKPVNQNFRSVQGHEPIFDLVHWLKIKNSSKIVYDYFRGLFPWPGIWTLINIRVNPSEIRENPRLQKRLKITNLELVDNKLIIKRVQLEGKKEVDFETFNKAYSIF